MSLVIAGRIVALSQQSAVAASENDSFHGKVWIVAIAESCHRRAQGSQRPSVAATGDRRCTGIIDALERPKPKG